MLDNCLEYNGTDNSGTGARDTPHETAFLGQSLQELHSEAMWYCDCAKDLRKECLETIFPRANEKLRVAIKRLQLQHMSTELKLKIGSHIEVNTVTPSGNEYQWQNSRSAPKTMTVSRFYKSFE